jgi:choline kinase
VGAGSPSEVPAVILAAGEGSRLGRMPSPKCLTSVCGRPIVAWIVDALAAAGVRTAYLILGNGAAELEAAATRLTGAVELRTMRCPEWQLGNGRTAAHVEAAMNTTSRFLLMMSDHLISAAHVAAVMAAGHRDDGCCVLGTASIRTRADTDDATKVLVDGDGRVLEISKTLDRYNAIDTGVFSMTSMLFPALAAASAAGDWSLTGGNRILASQRMLLAHSINDLPWLDVDTFEDLRAAEMVLARL